MTAKLAATAKPMKGLKLIEDTFEGFSSCSSIKAFIFLSSSLAFSQPKNPSSIDSETNRLS